MTIPKPQEKIKYLAEAIIVALLLTAAFVIGRVSALQGTGDTNPVRVVYPPLVSINVPKYIASGTSVKLTSPIDMNETSPSEPASWVFAGSKSGKIYYPRDCKSLDRVKPENRVYWNSEAKALAAGYLLSSACD